MKDHMTHIFRPFIFLLVMLLGFQSCKSDDPSLAEESSNKTFQVRKMHFPLWVRNASIVEIDVSNFTQEGSFTSLGKHLQRLKKMGISTIALLPIYPLSIQQGQESERPSWPIVDFTKVNPDLGTFEDFRALVTLIHQLNMHVLLHWVSNHTGGDHPWTDAHPKWYVEHTDTMVRALTERGMPGNRTALAKLDYSVGPLRNTMIESMKFWLRAGDVDGFICDGASLVPNDYWDEVRPALEQVKPVFMIAESEENGTHFETCFQANYAHNFNERLSMIAKGESTVSELDEILAKNRSISPAGYYQLNPLPNLMSSGELWEQEMTKALAVIAFTQEGLPLIEGGSDLAIFEHEHFYTKLVQLKNFNKSLWNGQEGGALKRINNSDEIYAFTREKNGHRTVVIVNGSNQPAETSLTEDVFAMSALFRKSDLNISKETPIKLKAWEYWLFANPSIETN